MQDIQGTALEEKYRHELHCNEVMLLPYYIASLNIEQEFFQRTQKYLPFQGITLADTFELLEDRGQLPLFTKENTERVERQKAADMFVVIGNPPYNMGQVNENDNNKNRKYKTMDSVLKETYSNDSKARNKNALSDPYVKAILWASRRIGEEGVVAFVTNNGFLDGIAFDGMRKNLTQDFTKIYHIDLKGNARTSGERRRKEGGNVFDDQIRVGVGISFFIKMQDKISNKETEVWIYSVDDYLKAREKQKLLTDFRDYTNVPLKKTTIDAKHTWLTEGLHAEFDTFIPIVNKIEKGKKSERSNVIFDTFGVGLQTSRDAWLYNFNENTLIQNVKRTSDFYNMHVLKFREIPKSERDVDEFVEYKDSEIKWSSGLKNKLKQGVLVESAESKLRVSLFRPYTKTNLCFDRTLNHRMSLFPNTFPTAETETENRLICLNGIGNKEPFHTLIVDVIPDYHLTGDSRCFPFYTYNEDGTNRQENITDWALAEYRKHYSDDYHQQVGHLPLHLRYLAPSWVS